MDTYPISSFVSFTLDIFKTSSVADPEISKSGGPAPQRGANPSKIAKN
jgi:hypothetical protein